MSSHKLSNIYICPDCGSQSIRTQYDFRTRETTVECTDCGAISTYKEDEINE